MKQNIFIGGAWPYANGLLHVGHLAALLPGDVIARYYRKCGANVLYVSGTDSHGTPITTRARKENCKPKMILAFPDFSNFIDFYFHFLYNISEYFHIVIIN